MPTNIINFDCVIIYTCIIIYICYTNDSTTWISKQVEYGAFTLEVNFSDQHSKNESTNSTWQKEDGRNQCILILWRAHNSLYNEYVPVHIPTVKITVYSSILRLISSNLGLDKKGPLMKTWLHCHIETVLFSSQLHQAQIGNWAPTLIDSFMNFLPFCYPKPMCLVN